MEVIIQGHKIETDNIHSMPSPDEEYFEIYLEPKTVITVWHPDCSIKGDGTAKTKEDLENIYNELNELWRGDTKVIEIN